MASVLFSNGEARQRLTLGRSAKPITPDQERTLADAAPAPGLGRMAPVADVTRAHFEGEGSPAALAADVKAVWDAIKAVRVARPQPADGFGGPMPKPGKLDAEALAAIVGHPAPVSGGVAKITLGREGRMHGQTIDASMGLTTWAAFSGSDQLAAMDGDFIMATNEVQPVLHALRKGGIHIVALHNHMIGGRPAFYFAHFWGEGNAATLARGFRAALDTQAAIAQR